MKLIKSLELRNISRVEHEVIEFGMLNRVEGENQAGKSTCIYDPLEVALLGQSLPADMIREGFRDGSIRVNFTDGSFTEISRSGNKQQRVIGYADGKTKTFDTVAAKEIVYEVQAFTGFQEITFTKDLGKESFQFIPLEAPQVDIMLKMDPKSVLRRITKVVGGTGAETAKFKLEQEVRKLNTSKTVQSELLKQAEQRFETIWSQIDFPAMEEDYLRLTELSNRCDELVARHQAVKSFALLRDSRTALLAQVKAVYVAPKVVGSIIALKGFDRDRANAKQSFDFITKCLDRGEAIDEKLSQVLPIQKRIKAAMPKLQEAKEKHVEVRDHAQEVQQLFANRDVLRRQIKSLDDRKRIIQRDIDNYVPPVKETCGTCPECGQPIVLESAA